MWENPRRKPPMSRIASRPSVERASGGGTCAAPMLHVTAPGSVERISARSVGMSSRRTQPGGGQPTRTPRGMSRCARSASRKRSGGSSAGSITGPGGQTGAGGAGCATARAVALMVPATIRKHVGDLDRVRRVVKLLGMINSAPGFEQQPQVMNGASDLFHALWGPEFREHARSAIGVSELGAQIPVEVDGIFELHPT